MAIKGLILVTKLKLQKNLRQYKCYKKPLKGTLLIKKKNFVNSSFVSDSIMQKFVNMFFLPVLMVLFLKFKVIGEEEKIKSC